MTTVTPHATLPDRDLKGATLPDARETMSCPVVKVPEDAPRREIASTLPCHGDDVGQTKPTAG